VHDAFALTAREAVAEKLEDRATCWIGVRPEDVHIGAEEDQGIPASVYVTEPLGGETVVDLRIGDRVVKALAPAALTLEPDQRVAAHLDPTRLHVFSNEGDAILSAAGAAEVFEVAVSAA
jgi:ABC-type sugar transport system ATPase subunit